MLERFLKNIVDTAGVWLCLAAKGFGGRLVQSVPVSHTLSMTKLCVSVATGVSAVAGACETTPCVAHRQGSSRKRREQQQEGIDVSKGPTPAWQTNFCSKPLHV